MQWDLNELRAIFVTIVSTLENKEIAAKSPYVISNNGRYMNFRPQDFKKAALELESIGSQDYVKFMRIYRTLEWIICDKGKFTLTQSIKGKTVRVISVDLPKYQLLLNAENKM